MISAVVPTFGGSERLARHLGGVVDSLRACGEPWEVLVVDDAGGGIGDLPEGARLVVRRERGGYGPAVNSGARQARGEHLLVLNDDVRLERDAVARLRERFPDPGLFAAVPRIRSRFNVYGDEAGRGARWSAGTVELVDVPARDGQSALYPVGCCYLCPRALFLELGGYDDVYAPFFWEDVDLGFRAWRRGLATRNVPDAVCHHEGSATIAERHSLAERERIAFRNRVLFHLLNLQEPQRRAATLGAWLAYALLEERVELRAGLLEALARYAEVGPRPEAGASDSEILALMPDPDRDGEA